MHTYDLSAQAPFQAIQMLTNLTLVQLKMLASISSVIISSHPVLTSDFSAILNNKQQNASFCATK